MEVVLEIEGDAQLQGSRGGNRRSGTIKGSARGIARSPARPVPIVIGAGAIFAGFLDIIEGLVGRDL